MIRLFVAVGNPTQPFDRMLQMVEGATRSLVVGGLCQHGVSGVRVGKLDNRAFVERVEFEREIERAQVAIVHAGVGAIASATRLGLRPIVVCRRAEHGEHADDHQVEIARMLESRGEIVVVEDAASMRNAIVDAAARARCVPGVTTPPEVLGAVARALEGPRRRPVVGARLLVGVMSAAVPILRAMAPTRGAK